LGLDGPVGAVAERRVASHLKRRGYRVLAQNVRNRFGEIDIVAEAPDGRTIAIVEVKASESALDDPPPELRVNAFKQRKLVALACQLARRYDLTDRPIRFDVAGVLLEPGQEPVIRYHEAAFESHV
jgi:putative endonuclease